MMATRVLAVVIVTERGKPPSHVPYTQSPLPPSPAPLPGPFPPSPAPEHPTPTLCNKCDDV